MTLKTLALPVALAASLLAAAPTQAAGQIYVGGKIGVADLDKSGVSTDPSVVAGVYGGFNLLGKNSQFGQDLRGGTLSAEGEALLTLMKGDATPGGDWALTSLGAFAAYRHPLTDYFYLKGKLGVVHYDPDVVKSDNTLAAGIGAGWKVGPGSLEAELASYGNDLHIFSAGFHMSF